ncbi:MAG: hypothetical protein BSK19_07620 [Stenotrophomonas maltophilia]|uniref:hypothetical protein n=1 Tax=Stenotrophomonas indicatrix TaxID=2045451 RepID=UPI0009289AA8|nr:hypothetical protein [Stenotrophomonas indicatrix]MDN8648924.1 hypothetical protein [Stenotrophomonas indicatrix]OJH80130.1 MAG: hypothetical protein BSK19_07620 [Stenotrophomonas maltophilia]
MLSDAEQDTLVEMLVATAEVMGEQIRPTAAAYMVTDLASYPLRVLAEALTACRREVKGRLSLAAVMERIDDGHPAPNEAWAVAIRAADEAVTVVWTEQTRDAWTAALPLVEQGDKIAARQAFLEVYVRLVKCARAVGGCAVYQPSLGHDASARAAALQLAVDAGRLAHEQVADHLALLPATPAFNPLALLAGRVEATPEANERTKQRLAEIAELFAPAQDAAA